MTGINQLHFTFASDHIPQWREGWWKSRRGWMYSGSLDPEWPGVRRRQSASMSESHCGVEKNETACQKTLDNSYS